MKKIALLCLSLCYSATLLAAPPKEIVFFGDSLTDDGNLYKVLKMPKSPPYFEGRFSNGFTWADDVADAFSAKYSTSAVNYAVGGATVVWHNPFKGYLPYVLDEEVTAYIDTSSHNDKSQTLFIIWMGANDYLSGSDNVDQLTTQVTDEISRIVMRLASSGGKNFVVLNLPDLAKTPYAQTVKYKDTLHNLAITHNLKLATDIVNLQKAHPDLNITLGDVYSVVDDLIANPEKYNQKYGTTISNVTEACWTGGYDLQKDAATKMSEELHQTLIGQTSNNTALQMSQYYSQQPAVAEAYAVAKAYELGLSPCDTPDTHIFWDHVHPTRVAHHILSAYLMENYLQK